MKQTFQSSIKFRDINGNIKIFVELMQQFV